MIIIFAIFLATVVTSNQGKYIELLSNEEFQDIVARRAGGDDSNEDNNSKQISSEESHIDIGNRDDKSYIPDVDLALAGINRRSHKGENPTNNTNFNDILLPLHEGSVTIDDNNNNNTREGEKVNQEKNTPDNETPKGVSDTEQIKTGVILSNETNTNNTLSAQAPDHNSEIHVPENDYNFESSSKTIEPLLRGGSVDTLTDKSLTDSFIDTTTNESVDILTTLETTLDSQVFTTTTQNKAEENTSTTEDNSAVTESSSTKEYLETITETTTFIPALTPTIEEVLTTTTEKEQSTKKTKKISNTVFSSVNEIENTTISERCKYCYRVYEILYPTKRRNKQFLRNQEPIKGLPYFVPVYKFAPNFAYYNPKNRLGPNEVMEKTIELGTRQHGERNIDNHDTVKASDLIIEINNDLRKFKVFKSKNKFGRMGSKKTHGTKPKVKKIMRIFDDTNIDMIPELMFAKQGTAYTYENLVAMKHARIQHLFDIMKLGDVKANLNKVQNETIKKRSNDESKINIQMNVLKDLILKDSNALQKYDYLATTVQIQAALMKILELIKRMRQSKPVHPADLQILKYIVFLHKFSLGVEKDNNWMKRAKLLPKNKHKKKSKLLKEKGLINRVWLLRTLLPNLVEEDEFSHLYDFIIKVQDSLFDLHEAVRYIAIVTKFDHQNWYGNLKQLYLSADENHLRELLLHISMSRLIDLVEHSCKQGLDHDFTHFLESHEKDAIRIVEELLFIDEIVDEIEINMK